MTRKLTRREQLAWAAGLFDGEGSIGLQYEGSRSEKSLRLRMRLMMTDAEAVERFRAIVSAGTLTVQQRTDGRKTSHCWFLQEREALLRVLVALSPYLVVKRWEALMGVAFLKNRELSNKHRRALFEEMKSKKIRPRRQK